MLRSVSHADRANRSGTQCTGCAQFPQTEWSELCSEDLTLLCAAKMSCRFSAGQSLYAQGDANSGMYCLSSGTVALRQIDESGTSVLLSLAYPGDVLGYRSLVSGQDHKVSAEALGPCEACKVGRQTALTLIERRPALGLAFLRRSSREIERMHESFVRSASLNNRRRLLQILAEMMEHHGQTQEDGAHSIDLPISRRDLASMIGTRHETLSRVMSRIEEEELARFSGRKVLIPDVAAFVDAAYEV
jgi:CRP-like cAMP-binding protein